MTKKSDESDEISKIAEGVYTQWNNGRHGGFVYFDRQNLCYQNSGLYDGTLRFVECDSRFTNYSYPQREWGEKCPIVAEGFVVFYIFHRNSAARDIYENYYCDLRKLFIDAENQKPDSYRRDLNAEFYARHIMEEKERISFSDALFEYLTEEQKPKIQSYINSYFEYIEREYSNDSSNNDNNNNNQNRMNSNAEKVFIVHGNDNFEQEVARFIEKLDLDAIILKEEPSGGRSIIEKIENYSDVNYGIALYTPCDKGYKIGDETNLANRARQNVLFEHGYLIGKLGRSRVAFIVDESVEIPSDIDRIGYVARNNWETGLIRELKNAGFSIDANKTTGA